MQTHPRLRLIEHFKTLPDPRVTARCDHALIDILVIALCTQLCGGESFPDMEDFGHAKEEWFKTFLRLPNGIPGHDTFNRVFAALQPAAFLEGFLQWTQSLRTMVAREIVALDGKALRRALDEGQAPRYIVSAGAASNRLVLGQIKVDDKSNEITAVPRLLRVLELAGCIVTLDAMGCQKNIAQEITEADAIVQDEKIKPPAQRQLAFYETVEKGHGRWETRRYWQSADLGWFADLSKWEGLHSVGVAESVRQVGTQAPKVERRYYLSSLKIDVEKFAEAVRGHWGVENSLHWVLDVQCGEDDSRARTGHAAENLATLRRPALNLLKKDQTKKRGIKGKPLNAGWDHSYLLRLLSF